MSVSTTYNQQLLHHICQLAEKASGSIIDIRNRCYSVSEKSDASPVTEADLISHNIICEGLQKLTPEIPVLSEEHSHITVDQRLSWQRYWLIDPLDGTRDFIQNRPGFTVNIALINNHEPILGVVYAPMQQTCYYAHREIGAFMQKNGQEPLRVHTRFVNLERISVVASFNHAGEQLEQYLRNLPSHDRVAIGSSLKFCLIAQGSADLYPRLSPTSEWDTAAAQAVLETAGGKVITLDGVPLTYNRRDTLLNPYFLAFGDASQEQYYLDALK